MNSCAGVVAIAEDPFLCPFLRTVLKRAGYRSIEIDVCHAQPVTALPEAVDYLITNTPQAFRAVAADVPLIYTTSCPDAAATEGFANWCVLRKPFQSSQLLDALHRLGSHALP